MQEPQETASIPESGRSPGRGHGNPVQYSCLENPMDRGDIDRLQPTGSQRVEHDRSNLACNTHINLLLLQNKLPQLRSLKQYTFIMFQFPGVEGQAPPNWVFCLGSHKAGIKVLAAAKENSKLIVISRGNFFVMGGLTPSSIFLLAINNWMLLTHRDLLQFLDIASSCHIMVVGIFLQPEENISLMLHLSF